MMSDEKQPVHLRLVHNKPQTVFRIYAFDVREFGKHLRDGGALKKMVMKGNKAMSLKVILVQIQNAESIDDLLSVVSELMKKHDSGELDLKDSEWSDLSKTLGIRTEQLILAKGE